MDIQEHSIEKSKNLDLQKIGIGRSSLDLVRSKLREIENYSAFVEARADEFSMLLDTLDMSVSLLHRAVYELPVGRCQQDTAEFLKAFELTTCEVKPLVQQSETT